MSASPSASEPCNALFAPFDMFNAQNDLYCHWKARLPDQQTPEGQQTRRTGPPFKRFSLVHCRIWIC
jgi:hypothetical protein